ncbi:MAG: rhamnulokinase family protein [Lachnospiraceae bacterium]|nr:rhamnulokinase family protein [Lachnospiraceae bacterium]
MSKNILAFDLGASSGKLFLARFHENGAIDFDEIYRFPNAPIELNGGLYWDILHIFEEMTEGIRKAVELTDDNIDSFAIDAFCNDFGLMAEDGTLLTQVRCYRDSRTARHEETIYAKMSREELYRRTGNQNALFNCLMHLAAMREEGQGYLIDNAHQLLFVPDLLLHFMTGLSVTEYTLASVSQFYDFRTRDWNREIMETFQIPERILAPLTDPGTIIGKTSEDFNQKIGSKGFSVSTVCEHDTGSAYLSAPSRSGSSILINCGTWALVGMAVEEALITPEGYAFNLANEGSIPGRHRLLRNIPSSWLIQETQRCLHLQGQDYSYSQLDQLAREAQPFRYFFDPDDPEFFQGEDMPGRVRRACLDLCGSAPDSVGELIRCIYETVALKFRWIIETMEKITGNQVKDIHMMGGGCQSTMLCQYTANACGRPVIAGPVEATAIGNIAVQMLANGMAASIDEASSRLQSAYEPVTYEPEDIQAWEVRYQEFLAAIATRGQIA